MSDNSRRVSRRTALKGIAAVASTGAVGAGGIIHGAEPVAAVEHQLAVEDAVIGTHDGDVAEIGIKELWFEASWNNIPDSVRCAFTFGTDTLAGRTLGSGDLGVSGDGSETFGYGQSPDFRYNFDVNLGSLGYDTPLSTTWSPILEEIGLSDDEDEKTTTIEFTIRLYRVQDEEEQMLDESVGEFDLVVERLEPEGEVGDGEA
ncbi:MAG TPA: hypothetical protein VKA37_02970, partial [Halobacteriales archaeon]|nr:hypothetical protein [Halobacteriales archaeon]